MLFSRLFRSRWAALLWAGGIVWTAIDIADASSTPDAQRDATAAQTDALGDPVTNDQLEALAKAMR